MFQVASFNAMVEPEILEDESSIKWTDTTSHHSVIIGEPVSIPIWTILLTFLILQSFPYILPKRKLLILSLFLAILYKDAFHSSKYGYNIL